MRYCNLHLHYHLLQLERRLNNIENIPFFPNSVSAEV